MSLPLRLVIYASLWHYGNLITGASVFDLAGVAFLDCVGLRALRQTAGKQSFTRHFPAQLAILAVSAPNWSHRSPVRSAQTVRSAAGRHGRTL